MPNLNWPTESRNAQPSERVVVVPRTPDYDHPYARVPKPPPIRSKPKVTVVPPPLQRKASPVPFSLLLAVGVILAICGAAYYVMSKDYTPTAQDRKLVNAHLAVPEIMANETPADFVKAMDVQSVRLASGQSRASINGKVYRVGDVVDEYHGLVFVGHDPDGEFLLFRDPEQQVHFYSLYKE
ncbi:hypothetical protein [Cerasicoccus arenae]|uniref:Uncharacterized protein n=1 Tax=Cerasicoccus arenae TaxID=424488 RepID=A0A8J3GFC3_9BACT|nr:hypothetical protein [Cerasicoccus arenae]MBK1858509.1 hypothetical protein [Cerasicoccus arenae]GHC10180.1 hypothetical protein GCM10007047_29370 [Cerasicoccus arenae]